jgi:hypothetical protein
MSEDRKKSVRFLKEFSSKAIPNHEAFTKTRTIGRHFLFVCRRARVLSQSATGKKSVLKKSDQFCYNPQSCIIDR